MDLSKYRFYVGTARGVLLSTGEKPNEIKIYKNSEATEVSAVGEGRSPDEIILGYQSGNAHVFDTLKASFTRKIDNLEGDDAVVGCCCVRNSVLIGRRDGVVNINRKRKNDFFSLNLDESGSLDAMLANRNRENLIGTGGEFNDYKLWDIESKQCVFKAKSLGHDYLQLPIPTSVRALTFFNDEPHLGACCTKEGHVLLYDDRAQRRPTVKFHEAKASYTSICSKFGTQQVFVGTSKGYLQWLDLRRPVKILKTFTSFTGSVTGVCDFSENFVASVSLDRYLRVHNADTKELITKLYMKQNLTKLLVKQIIKDEKLIEEVDEEKVVDQEYEDLFDGMEEIREEAGEKKKKKTKHKKEEGVKSAKKARKI